MPSAEANASEMGDAVTAVATGEVEFDLLEGGAPWEGDLLGRGLCSAMPDWVKEQIDVSDYVGYLQPPVGTWNGNTYRVNIDGDCHNFNYRSDYFSNADLAAAWTAAGNVSNRSVLATCGRDLPTISATSSCVRRKSSIMR